jgi:hypothetical protein
MSDIQGGCRRTRIKRSQEKPAEIMHLLRMERAYFFVVLDDVDELVLVRIPEGNERITGLYQQVDHEK